MGGRTAHALLNEWLPPARKLSREEALAELARRYFMSHGPATLQDFAWWSGLAPADAMASLEMIKTELLATTAEQRTYWYAPTASGRRQSRSCHLLPAFDEYTVAYNDRSAALSDEDASRPESGHGIFYPTIVIDGQIAGT